MMVYLDTSVFLADILSEDTKPPPALWEEQLFSSRLLHYEAWNRLHTLPEREDLWDAARARLARIHCLELHPHVLQRALDPFPKAVRTLDALHLASWDFLNQRGMSVFLASYDERMCAVVRALKGRLYPLRFARKA